ncbi:hypothetical protein [Pseudomonas sp. P9_31]|uniref:hypothetical protein n=1 Tax=Pseudomonas sp. P9_31 TaxID=3043448 RepID=UPI002A365AC8|nr:hypothetical protein [Pseudomonas sp. P9_31]WPN56850.1 hypothetical protein QMK51_22340 [Pseudomonas sp. P9_31]
MARVTNRKIEEQYFDSFRQHYVLPSGTIEYSDKPDVLILDEGGQRILGIEITRLYQTEGGDLKGEQRQIKMRRNVIDRAEDIYLSRGGRKICLHISFDPNHPIIGKEHVKKTAENLALFALGVSSHRDMYTAYNPIEASPELSYLHHDGNEYPLSNWENPQVYDTPALLVERVKKEVANKAAKVLEYQNCEAQWLLIVVDYWDSSQDQGTHWPVDEDVGRTPFERILIYKTCFNEVVEVTQGAL